MPDFEKLILNRDVKRLIQLARGRRNDYRLQAIRGLGAARAWRAIPLLAGQLEDPSTEIRDASIEALGAIRRREAAAALLVALRSDWPDVRRRAWKALVGMGGGERAEMARSLDDFRHKVPTLLRIIDHLDPRHVLRQLIGLLDHVDRRVVDLAREKLTTLGAEIMEELHDAFAEGSLQQAREIAEILKGQAAETIPELKALLERVPGEPERQTAVLYALAETEDERVAEILRTMLRDPSRHVRTTALALLTRYRTQAIEAFKSLLREPDFPDRSRLIGYVRGRWQMWGKALIDLLSTEEFSDWRLRELAKMALGGRADLIRPLVERYLERGDLEVEDVVDLVLFDRGVAAKRVMALLHPLAEQDSEQGRRLLLLLQKTVAREAPDMVEPLSAAARDPSSASPLTAVRLLASTGPAGVPTVVDLISFKRRGTAGFAASIRARARETATEIGAPCGALLVRAMSLPGSTREVREAIVEVGDGALVAVVDELVRAFREDRDWKTYCRLLTKMKGEATEPLLPLVDHPSAEVRRAALRAMRGREGEAMERKLIAVVNASLGKRPVRARVLWSLEVLEQLGSPAARATMQRLVTHPDSRVRRRALDYVKHRAPARKQKRPTRKQREKQESGRILPPPLPKEAAEKKEP